MRLGDDIVELVEADGRVRSSTTTTTTATATTFTIVENERRRGARESRTSRAENGRTSGRSSGGEGGSAVQIFGAVESGEGRGPTVDGDARLGNGSLPEVGQVGGGRSPSLTVPQLGRLPSASMLDRRRQQRLTPYNVHSFTTVPLAQTRKLDSLTFDTHLPLPPPLPSLSRSPTDLSTLSRVLSARESDAVADQP